MLCLLLRLPNIFAGPAEPITLKYVEYMHVFLLCRLQYVFRCFSLTKSVFSIKNTLFGEVRE